MGRKPLFGDIKNGKIPDNMHWKTAFQLCPKFAIGDTPADAECLFPKCLTGAQKIVTERNARAASKLALLQQVKTPAQILVPGLGKRPPSVAIIKT